MRLSTKPFSSALTRFAQRKVVTGAALETTGEIATAGSYLDQ